MSDKDFDNKIDQILSTQQEIKLTLVPVMKMVEEHNRVINGDPENMGRGGLVATVQRHGQDIKQIKGIFSYIWAGVATGTSIAINKLWR